MPTTARQLRQIQSFEELIVFLEEELDWPLGEYSFEDSTFEYTPDELGLKDKDAAKVRAIHQLRPLHYHQPWGIFFVEFESKRMPVVVLRRILSHLVIKKRASANKAELAAWSLGDLIFISAFGDQTAGQGEIAFAHFHQEGSGLPTLRVLGWDGSDTPLKLEHVAATLRQRLRWPDDPRDADGWRAQWTPAFRHKPRHVIRTAAALADRLAELARDIRDAANTMMRYESAGGTLRRLHKAFQKALIHDLSQSDFADTYAQTITYGLLSAAISRTDMTAGRYGTALVAGNVTDMVPLTNPFLREMLQMFLEAGGAQGGINFDELGVQEVVDLLRGDETDLPAIVRDFGNRTQHEDPVIYFYEEFAKRYDPVEKVRRGEFYTPQPVVSYIVRSVNELLQTEFGLQDGLASTVTWREMAARHDGLEIPHGTDPGSPFVVILDPAAGTGTFPVEVIEVIYSTLTRNWQTQGLSKREQVEAWNEYVPKHLLPRLCGYELKMAPYAIAHMRIGLKLRETGFTEWEQLGDQDRVRVYLTNTLESATGQQPQQAFSEWAPALAHEALAVDGVKRLERFTIIVGNPPYAGWSANLTAEARAIVECYKYLDGKRIREKGALQFEKNLQDDYVKFFAWSERVITASAVGIIALISNNGFLDTPTLRGMRWHLLESFSQLYLLDLHGSTKRPIKADENVFDIQQGVAITLLVSHPTARQRETHVQRADLTGDRHRKYAYLSAEGVTTTAWKSITPLAPLFQFISLDSNLQSEYNHYISLTEVMPFHSTGTETGFDSLLVDFTKEELLAKIRRFLDLRKSDADVELEFSRGRGTARKLLDMRREFRADFDRKGPEYCVRGMYRVFDSRMYYYKKEYLKTNSLRVMRHLLGAKNVALVAFRQQSQAGFRHIFVTQELGDKNAVSLRTREVNYYFPLQVLPEPDTLQMGTIPSLNLSAAFLKELAEHLGVPSRADSGLPSGVAPEDILRYIYAILHSPGYRNRYGDFLKTDFPRVPLSSSLDLFRSITELGRQLVALHLMESPTLDRPITRFVERAAGTTMGAFSKSTCYRGGRVYLDTSQRSRSSFFAGVPEDVWNFHIGGYQVLYKWLYDRRGSKGQPGRTLTEEDIEHYQRIVVALKETIRLMGEIDEVIEEHGGWPIE